MGMIFSCYRDTNLPPPSTNNLFSSFATRVYMQKEFISDSNRILKKEIRLVFE
jgi:hypothetical protein